METHSGKKYTMEDLKGNFSIVMFGDSVTNHALQGLHKMQEIIAEQGKQYRICRRILHPACKFAKQFCMVSHQHTNMSITLVIIQFYQAAAFACLRQTAGHLE